MKNYTFLVAVFLMAACNSRTGNNSKYTIANGRTNKDNERMEGNVVFQQSCASCHNLTKEGTGPALNKQLIQNRNDDWIFMLITDQKHLRKDAAYRARVKAYGFSCPQVPISREKLKVLIAYIRNPSKGCMRY
jgi:mono/diheme cytochrome c family protein